MKTAIRLDQALVSRMRTYGKEHGLTLNAVAALAMDRLAPDEPAPPCEERSERTTPPLSERTPTAGFGGRNNWRGLIGSEDLVRFQAVSRPSGGDGGSGPVGSR